MHRIALRMIEFAVGYSAAGAHALHFPRTNGRAGAHAVAMLQLALQHISQDLHVAMRMSAKAAARLHAVFVDHAQAAKARVCRIVIVIERKGIARVQPAVIGMPALLTAPNLGPCALPASRGG